MVTMSYFSPAQFPIALTLYRMKTELSILSTLDLAPFIAETKIKLALALLTVVTLSLCKTWTMVTSKIHKCNRSSNWTSRVLDCPTTNIADSSVCSFAPVSPTPSQMSQSWPAVWSGRASANLRVLAPPMRVSSQNWHLKWALMLISNNKLKARLFICPNTFMFLSLRSPLTMKKRALVTCIFSTWEKTQLSLVPCSCRTLSPTPKTITLIPRRTSHWLRPQSESSPWHMWVPSSRFLMFHPSPRSLHHQCSTSPSNKLWLPRC